jgi:hypothetical protein
LLAGILNFPCLDSQPSSPSLQQPGTQRRVPQQLNNTNKTRPPSIFFSEVSENHNFCAHNMPSAAQSHSLVTFLGLSKKVTRLPAGTGGLSLIQLKAKTEPTTFITAYFVFRVKKK